MEIASEHRPVLRGRSNLGWKSVCFWSSIVTASIFLALNWKGCWLFRHEPRDLILFVYVFAWLAAFLAVRAKWRLALLAVTLILLVPRVFLEGDAEQNAGPESSAVDALQQMQSSLETYKIEHPQQGYPDVLPALTLSRSAQRFYRFEYVPNRSPNGEIRSYVLQAAPARRDCYLHRSFTITNDAKVFWTLEPRAATPSDTLVQ